MDNRHVKININLAGRIIPLIILPEYEAIVREEVKKVNRRFSDFKNTYEFENELDAIIKYFIYEIAEKAVLNKEKKDLEEKCRKGIDKIKKELESE